MHRRPSILRRIAVIRQHVRRNGRKIRLSEHLFAVISTEISSGQAPLGRRMAHQTLHERHKDAHHGNIGPIRIEARCPQHDTALGVAFGGLQQRWRPIIIGHEHLTPAGFAHGHIHVLLSPGTP